MSGNFTQRGLPAMYDKYTRAEAAVRCGIDLIIELPYPWCCEGAEGFAGTGVYLLSQFNPDAIVFATETGSIEVPELYDKIKYDIAFPEIQISKFQNIYFWCSG